jgi:sugar phosphate isomerase/epimerase
MFNLEIYRSLWTNGFDLDAALDDCVTGEFDGIEGPLPMEITSRESFLSKLAASGRPFIAEIVTGGDYVPTQRLPAEHLQEFRIKAEMAAAANPRFLTVLAGCDHWAISQSVEFLGQMLEIAAEIGLAAHLETHRSRMTFNPWSTRSLLEQLPTLTLTCDFSHWCCVCERFVMDEEPDLLALCVSRARHIHARIGYAQGPQAPHPFAPEYAEELSAHERWWQAIWRGAPPEATLTTMTPEAGPDGYLHTLPFTNQPVASLNQINRQMATRQRQRFLETFPLSA